MIAGRTWSPSGSTLPLRHTLTSGAQLGATERSSISDHCPSPTKTLLRAQIKSFASEMVRSPSNPPPQGEQGSLCLP